MTTTTPKTKKQISVKLTGASTTDYIIIQNPTQGWRKAVKANAAGEIVYNPADDGYTCAEDDSIYLYANGRVTGNTSGTVSSGGVTITATVTADTKSQAVIMQ